MDPENSRATEPNESNHDPLTEALKNMTVAESVEKFGIDVLKDALLDKFKVFETGRVNIENQLHALESKVDKNNTDFVHRVDRLINLMNSNAAFIRQMIDLLDDYGSKLNAFEKDSIRHKMEYAAVVENMNRMARNFVKVEDNQREIVDEIEDLKQRQEEDDRFKWKLVTIVGLIGIIVSWLCVGDHLKNCIIIIQKSLFGE